MTKTKVQMLQDMETLVKQHKSSLDAFLKLKTSNIKQLSSLDLLIIENELSAAIYIISENLQDLKGGNKQKQNGKR